MIRDCLINANSTYKFNEKIADVNEYLKLTDNILLEIENSKKKVNKFFKVKDLTSAKNLISRLRKRDLYKCIGEHLIRNETENQIFKKLTPQEFANYQNNHGDGQLKEEDIEIIMFDITCGLGEKNPIDFIKFYQNEGESENFN